MKPKDIISNLKPIQPKESGIYMIYCKTNEKCYVGRATNLYSRFAAHRSELKFNTHFNSHLQAMYNKYGKDSLEFYILELTQVKGKREAHWASLINPDYIVNMAAITDEFPVSEITREKMSKAQIGRKATDEAKLRMSLAKLGKKYGPRKPHTEQTKQKIREKAINQWNKQKLEGYKKPPTTDETRVKMSSARLGKKASKKTKKKISMSLIGNSRARKKERIN